MRIDIMTLFPATVDAGLHESIIGRAAKKGIVEINCVQIRDYTENKQNQVDDYPYGGGFGCVMMAQPLKSCLDAIKAQAVGVRRRLCQQNLAQKAALCNDPIRQPRVIVGLDKAANFCYKI